MKLTDEFLLGSNNTGAPQLRGRRYNRLIHTHVKPVGYMRRWFGSYQHQHWTHQFVRLTSFQQDDLVVLTEIHEAVDAFGELHHVLYGLGDLHGTELPHHLPRLQRTQEKHFKIRDANSSSSSKNHSSACKYMSVI